MAEMNDSFSKLSEFAKKLSNHPLMEEPPCSLVHNIIPTIPSVEIDRKSTFAYQMQQQTNQLIEKNNEQIRLLNEHNEQLVNNYNKLEELYSLKSKEFEKAKQDAKNSKNKYILATIISVISLFVAIASWVFPR